MSQAAPNAPSVIVNAGGKRHQVSLRDYLNGRVAPFLKKAITESLGVEAEFPLQWLGECLIHQSILYEGNPDRTHIRERFLYKFEDPKPQEPADSSSAPEATPPQPETANAPSQDTVQDAPEISMNESTEPTQITAEPLSTDTASAQPPPVQEQAAPQATPAAEVAVQESHSSEAPVVNGVDDEGETSQPQGRRDEDTEMGGTA